MTKCGECGRRGCKQAKLLGAKRELVIRVHIENTDGGAFDCRKPDNEDAFPFRRASETVGTLRTGRYSTYFEGSESDRQCRLHGGLLSCVFLTTIQSIRNDDGPLYGDRS